MQKGLSPVHRLWQLVREEKSDISAIYFFAIVNGLIQLSLPIGIQAIIGFTVGGLFSASVVVLIIIVVSGVGFNGIMQIKQMQVIEKIQQRIFVRYAFAFATHLPKLDLQKVNNYFLPELVTRFFDTVTLQKSLSKILLDLPIAIIQILFGLLLLSFYHPFFIFFGLLLVFLLWLMIYTTGDKGMQSSLAESRYKYELVAWFAEMARLVKSGKFFSFPGLSVKKADHKTIHYLAARTNHFHILQFHYKVLIGFKVAITGSMLMGGVLLLLQQQINIGQFVAAEIVILTIIASVEKLITNLDGIYDVLTAVEKIAKLTDKPVEAAGTYPMQNETAWCVEAKNLQFGYESERPIIKNLSFQIMAGDKVCVSGADGAGKSTLLNLLAGLYTNFSGSLLMNQIPISNYTLPSLRANISILFLQETIFQGSLLENITMGSDKVDMTYLQYLCKETGLQPFIASLPAGYDTELDATGRRLSRSVIQKILFIRALVQKPCLLIMEEPWQGIEDQYKQQMQALLLGLQNTTVVIATNEVRFIQQCTKKIHVTN